MPPGAFRAGKREPSIAWQKPSESSAKSYHQSLWPCSLFEALVCSPLQESLMKMFS